MGITPSVRPIHCFFQVQCYTHTTRAHLFYPGKLPHQDSSNSVSWVLPSCVQDCITVPAVFFRYKAVSTLCLDRPDLIECIIMGSYFYYEY